MIEVNGVALTAKEIKDRLALTNGGEPLIIKEPLKFELHSNMSRSRTLVDKETNHSMTTMVFPDWHMAIETSNFYVPEKGGQGTLEQVYLYTSKLKQQNETYLYQYKDSGKITFEKGIIVLQPGDEDVLLFLRMHDRNQSNIKYSWIDDRGEFLHRVNKSFLFREVFPEKEAKVSFTTSMARLVAAAAAMDSKALPDEAALSMAISYGAPFNKQTPMDEVRVFLLEKAESDPKQFTHNVKSQSYLLKAMVSRAFEEKVITFDSTSKRVLWGKKVSIATTGNRPVIHQITRGLEAEYIDQMVIYLRDKDTTGITEKIRTELESIPVVTQDDDNSLHMAAQLAGVEVEELIELRAAKALKLKEQATTEKTEAKAEKPKDKATAAA